MIAKPDQKDSAFRLIGALIAAGLLICIACLKGWVVLI